MRTPPIHQRTRCNHQKMLHSVHHSQNTVRKCQAFNRNLVLGNCFRRIYPVNAAQNVLEFGQTTPNVLANYSICRRNTSQLLCVAWWMDLGCPCNVWRVCTISPRYLDKLWQIILKSFLWNANRLSVCKNEITIFCCFLCCRCRCLLLLTSYSFLLFTCKTIFWCNMRCLCFSSSPRKRENWMGNKFIAWRIDIHIILFDFDSNSYSLLVYFSDLRRLVHIFRYKFTINRATSLAVVVATVPHCLEPHNY